MNETGGNHSPRTVFTVDLNPTQRMKSTAAGSTGERPFFEIISSLRYWVLHTMTLTSIFLADFLFVSTGLAYEDFGATPPDADFYAFLKL